ncbi:MAG: tetratricopeptide repeat protein [Prevotellamassilia sp.]|nr:tetratricopeptide repeat protein [Prevotellamassilia sp.]
MQKGNRAFENKDYSKAELNYLNVLKAHPSSAEALFNLGNTQLGKNNAQAALDYFEKAKQSSADTTLTAMALHNQGYVYQASAMSSTKEDERQQQLRTAIDHYKQALRLNPADNNTRYNLALCQKLLKDSQQTTDDRQQTTDDKQNQQNEACQQTTDNRQQTTDDKQTQQLLNLAKQAEKRAKEKVDKAMKNRRPKNLEKNW